VREDRAGAKGAAVSRRQPSKQPGLVTVRCTDGRWFQARKGNPALPDRSAALDPAEWEVRNELVKLYVAARSLDSAPFIARLFRLARYRQAKVLMDHATRSFQRVAGRSQAHQAAARMLGEAFAAKSGRPINAP
jgi:hypothetical protein